MPRPDDTLTLLVQGQRLQGWQEIRVTRGIERCPADFDLELTERFPGQAAQASVLPGQTCEVRIGSDLVLTGYLDRLSLAIGPRGHTVRAQGRSKCEDLVDCSAVLPNMNVQAAGLVQLATDLCKPFGIAVSAPDGEGEALVSTGSGLPPFNVTLGETPWELIERTARWRRLLAYDDPAGNLVLAKVGAAKHASGLAQGKNVQAAEISYSKDQRFTDYLPALLSTETVGDIQSQTGINGNRPYPPVLDPAAFAGQPRADGQPRYRPHFVVSEQQIDNVSLCTARAEWEKARRYGRSQSVRVTCDSWRDSAGKLWTPNVRAPVELPALKLELVEWVIGEVSYRRGREGTVAELALMPAEAFQPEPVFAAGFDWQVTKALHDGVQAQQSARQGDGLVP